MLISEITSGFHPVFLMVNYSQGQCDFRIAPCDSDGELFTGSV